jgi:drug/metabolite transporter (DMT)-like permease
MTDDAPWYLLLPLAASLLFAMGLIFLKKASRADSGPWTVTLVTNLWSAVLFAGFWPLGGTSGPWWRLWQPGVVAVLYVAGQVCTFLALHLGDVSVAAPIFSVKVLMVAVFLTVIGGGGVSPPVWLAAAAATAGVALIQFSGGSVRRGSVAASVIFALLAATLFALFDVLVQRWAPSWGVGRFLPLVFGLGAVLSLAVLPWRDVAALRLAWGRWPLLLGGFLVALQSVFIVLAVALFGDAARVNIVYALRGIWGVSFAWLLARWLGGGELHLPRQVMVSRFVGAALVTVAVVVAILARTR